MKLSKSVCTVRNILFIFFIVTLCLKTKAFLIVYSLFENASLQSNNNIRILAVQLIQTAGSSFRRLNYCKSQMLMLHNSSSWIGSTTSKWMVSFEWAETVKRLNGIWTLSTGPKYYWDTESAMVLFRAKGHVFPW